MKGHFSARMQGLANSEKLIWSRIWMVVVRLGDMRGHLCLPTKKIVVQTGSPHGSLVALDAQTGKKIWRGGRVECRLRQSLCKKSKPE